MSRRVSVALSTHDGDRYLPEQLASLAAQTLLPAELVVRDDGSTDGTRAVLEEFAATAPFPVHVSSGPRLGQARSLAEVLLGCTGDVVALCDQDDVWRPDKLAVTVAALAGRSGAAGAFGNGDLVDDRGRPLRGTTFRALAFTGRRRRRFEAAPVAVLASGSVVPGHALLVRRDVIDRALPFPDRVLADPPAGADVVHPDRWISLVAVGTGPLVAVDDRLVEHRQHPSQQTGVDARPLVRAGREARRWVGQIGGGPATRERWSDRAELLGAAAERTGSAALAEAAGLYAFRAMLPVRRRARIGTIRRAVRAGRYRWSDGGQRVALADVVRPLGGRPDAKVAP